MTNDSWIKNRHQLFNDLKSPKSDQTQFYIFYSIIKWSGQTLRASTPSIFDLLYGNKSPNFFANSVIRPSISPYGTSISLIKKKNLYCLCVTEERSTVLQ